MKSTSYNIFYTDDDSDDHELFVEVVNSLDEQHQVYTQSDGGELLQVLKQPPPAPDIIFLDLNMPNKNGFQVLEEMKADERLKNIPVIVFSTSDNEIVIQTCINMGANMYLTKPDSYPRMKNMLQEVLSLDWKKNARTDPGRKSK